MTKNKRLVAITGATGTMGQATMKELMTRLDVFDIRLLIRDSRRNRRLSALWLKHEEVSVVWGDLLDKGAVNELVRGADIVLHMGGLVSPQADHKPHLAYRVNVEGTRNIVDAIIMRRQAETTAMVYIGSVAQYGPRAVPQHWGVPGDPVHTAYDDWYAQSKIDAERIVSESGLKRWVALRQSAILTSSLLNKGTDPITFHVPLNGVLEWVTAEDSGRLMANICSSEVPGELWCDFYDIGGGESYRLTNYEFEALFLKAVSCPPPEKVFEPQWFAHRNFHGVWYADSDRLERLVPFRDGCSAEVYFKNMAASLPRYFKLASLVPAWVIKSFMRRVAMNKEYGTLGWLKSGNKHMLRIAFGTNTVSDDWNVSVNEKPSVNRDSARIMDLGFDRMKPHDALCIDDMRSYAEKRGGECLSEKMVTGDMKSKLRWKCGAGHVFDASPATVVLGGHWCERCLRSEGSNPGPSHEALSSDPLLREAFLSTHSECEL